MKIVLIQTLLKKNVLHLVHLVISVIWNLESAYNVMRGVVNANHQNIINVQAVKMGGSYITRRCV